MLPTVMLSEHNRENSQKTLEHNNQSGWTKAEIKCPTFEKVLIQKRGYTGTLGKISSDNKMENCPAECLAKQNKYSVTGMRVWEV